MAIRMGVHGNAVTVGEHPGGGAPLSGGDLLQVGGIPWTDVVGLRQGWGTTFRGQAGKQVWFHLPIPTPLIADLEENPQPRYVNLFVETDFDVFLQHVHIWDSQRRRLLALDDVNHHGSYYQFTIPDLSSTRTSSGISISMNVNFAHEGNVVFLGAMVDFLTPS